MPKDWTLFPYFEMMMEEICRFIKIGSDFETKYKKVCERIRERDNVFTEVFLRALGYPVLLYFMADDSKDFTFEESMEVVLLIVDYFIRNEFEIFEVKKLYNHIRNHCMNRKTREFIGNNKETLLKKLMNYKPFKCVKKDLQGRIIFLFSPTKTRSVRNLEKESYVVVFRKYFELN